MEKIEEKIKKIKKYLSQAIFKRKEAEKKLKRQKLIMVLTVFFVVVVFLLLLATPIFAYQYLYQNKIFSGVYIDGINMGGLTEQEAINKLNQHIDNLKLKGLSFNYNNHRYIIGLTALSPTDPDLSFPFLIFDNDKMVKNALNYGRQSNAFTNLYDQARALLYQKEITLEYKLNEKEIMGILQERYGSLEQPAANPGIVFRGNGYEITAEKNGWVIDYEQAISQLKENLNLIDINTVNLKSINSQADITRAEAMRHGPAIDKILQIISFTLKYDNKSWEVKTDEFKNWLIFVRDKENKILFNFSSELLVKKLKEISTDINIPARDASINFVDGKVESFRTHLNGLELDIEANIENINREFFKDQVDRGIDLIVNEIEPRIKTADINNMGISEVIGVGESDFFGSSSNRVANIRNASRILHGMLIKPDEEFSLVKAIGEVNAATGFFPEYVIKGDRTIKEYGGGLCQIATTAFRAAMYTGLPITERKSHSYIVSYYNPIGFDAAIYGPHPDVRFINDTGNYILFQTAIEGTKLTFTFWGTSDGRKVEITTPEIYNWRSPGPTKFIENPNLKPGEKKIVEYAKKGADTHFYRYITNADGEKKEEIWRSHYVAWPAVYEIGITPAVEGDADSELNTDAINNSQSGQADNSSTSINDNVVN